MQTDKMLVLASNSPRRREILSLFHKPFAIVVSRAEETEVAGESVEARVCRLSLSKAQAAAALLRSGEAFAEDVGVWRGEMGRKAAQELPDVCKGNRAGQSEENSAVSWQAGVDHALLIGADTLVEFGGQILGKPKDQGDAARMLALLSGRTHRVWTGFTVLDLQSSRTATQAVCTEVVFRAMSAREIAAYIDTGEPMDKAGAYGVQGIGSAFIKEIHGDFFNVVGLPVERLCSVLQQEFDYRLV